jgi:hypothetical protein
LASITSFAAATVTSHTYAFGCSHCFSPPPGSQIVRADFSTLQGLASK